jgi:hypothetical protein
VVLVLFYIWWMRYVCCYLVFNSCSVSDIGLYRYNSVAPVENLREVSSFVIYAFVLLTSPCFLSCSFRVLRIIE